MEENKKVRRASMGKNSVQELVAAVGVSGYEKAICSLITEKLTGLSDEVYADSVGNVICFRKGTDSQHKVMLISHMDEVGFQIMKFNNDGSAKLKPIGNVKTWNSVNQIIKTADGRVGIIICDDPSDIKPYDFNKLVVIPIIGELKIGDVLCFDSDFIEGKNVIVGKSIDNRVSCYSMLELITEGKQYRDDIYFVFSTQEEIGMRGARVAITSLNPDVIIDIDVSPVGEMNSLEIGKGVGIKISDSVGVADSALVKLCEEVACEASIPYQLEVSDCGTTELIITNEKDNGARRMGISIPCQNIHTARTLASKEDIENCIKLLKNVLLQITEKSWCNHSF